MVQPDFYLTNRLKTAWFSVLLSNPLTKDDFRFIGDRALVYVVVSLRNGVAKTRAETSRKQRLSPLALSAVWESCRLCGYGCCFGFSGSVKSSCRKKTWNEIQEGI
jgi:hypothetical protein